MADESIWDMAERLLRREITQGEMDRLSAAPTIADAQQMCNDILTREDRLTTANFGDDYERARRMMIILPTDDLNLIIDVIEGRRVEAFVKGFLSGGFEIRPVSSMPVFIQDMVAAGVDIELIKETFSRAITGHQPDTYRSQASLKMAFLQDMLESENVGLIEIEAAFEQAKEEYRKTVEED
jgi:DNA integrity scanning protein DisA with diadenylate cyclase activity